MNGKFEFSGITSNWYTEKVRWWFRCRECQERREESENLILKKEIGEEEEESKVVAQLATATGRYCYCCIWFVL